MPKVSNKSFTFLAHVEPIPNQPLMFETFFKKTQIQKLVFFSLELAAMHAKSIQTMFHLSSVCETHPKSTHKVSKSL